MQEEGVDIVEKVYMLHRVLHPQHDNVFKKDKETSDSDVIAASTGSRDLRLNNNDNDDNKDLAGLGGIQNETTPMRLQVGYTPGPWYPNRKTSMRYSTRRGIANH